MSGGLPRGPVHVHIEELVLHGVGEPADRHRIGDAAAAELRRLLALPGSGPWMHRGAADAPVLDAGEFTVDGSPTPAVLGAGVARAVHGLGGGAATGAEGG